jgi:hypothetical protein
MNGLKIGEEYSPKFFKFAIENAFRRAHAKQDGLKLNWFIVIMLIY